MSLDTAIANLRSWRALPGYSVERRIDWLLSPYLPAFLSRAMGAPVRIVLAEFPIPRRSAGFDPKDRLHLSADFLCLREGKDPAWLLVELKTDSGSRSKNQDRAYRAAAGRKGAMSRLLVDLEDAKSVQKADRVQKPKQDFLPGYSKVYWTVKRAGSTAAPIELCYVEPRGKGSPKRTSTAQGPELPVTIWSLGLGELARFVAESGDPLGELLREVLRGVARSDKARRGL
jgi:hypothetical protein